MVGEHRGPERGWRKRRAVRLALRAIELDRLLSTPGGERLRTREEPGVVESRQRWVHEPEDRHFVADVADDDRDAGRLPILDRFIGRAWQHITIDHRAEGAVHHPHARLQIEERLA